MVSLACHSCDYAIKNAALTPLYPYVSVYQERHPCGVFKPFAKLIL